MGFPRWPWRASCIVVCPSLRRPSAPPPDSAHPVSRGQFPAISSLPAGLSQAVATPFFSWGLRVVPLPIFGSPAVSPSTELPSARLPPAHFSLRADTLRGSMQRHCGCAKFLPDGGRAFSWKELDEYCQHVLSDIVTVELIGRLQSKTKAADILNMTLPAIRSRLMPVERTLKGSVAERGRNGELSPLGLKMRKFWEDIRGPLENFIVEVERLHDLDTLRLGIPQSIWESERKWLESEYEARMPGGSIQPVFADGFHTDRKSTRLNSSHLVISY